MAQRTITPLGERHDEELVALARGGDERAFAELYERYFRGLYDFTLRMLREQEAAADVVQTTFVKAWAALRQDKGVGNVKAWLYAVARNLAIDELRRRRRLATPRSDEDEDPIYTLVDERRLTDPSVAAHDHELVELVWECASALSPQEYSLLDLHLRQGLDADELADSLGLAKGAVYTRLSRLRDSLEETVTAAVLMRRGRRDCAELDALLTQMGAIRMTKDVRRAIRQHADDCEICGENKRKLVVAAELFAGLAPVPIPSGLAEAIWERIADQLGLGGAGGSGDGGPPDDGGGGLAASAKTKAALTTLGTLGAVALVGALLFARGGVSDPDDVHSTSHAVGRPSAASVVQMAWSREPGADGFSVTWTEAPDTLPDDTEDLDGDATGTASPSLAAGRWWFHLRTLGDGEWTHTVHVGPFVIVAAPAKPKPRRPSLTARRKPARTVAGPRVLSREVGVPSLTVVASKRARREARKERTATQPRRTAPRSSGSVAQPIVAGPTTPPTRPTQPIDDPTPTPVAPPPPVIDARPDAPQPGEPGVVAEPASPSAEVPQEEPGGQPPPEQPPAEQPPAEQPPAEQPPPEQPPPAP